MSKGFEKTQESLQHSIEVNVADKFSFKSIENWKWYIFFFKISRAITYAVHTMHLDTKKSVSKYIQQWKVMQPNERL